MRKPKTGFSRLSGRLETTMRIEIFPNVLAELRRGRIPMFQVASPWGAVGIEVINPETIRVADFGAPMIRGRKELDAWLAAAELVFRRDMPAAPPVMPITRRQRVRFADAG